MAFLVAMTAQLQCSFGMAPSVLQVIPQGQPVLSENKLQANIMANVPMVNVAPFGMCQSLANPTVATATAAAMGVLTPMPCIPVLPAPWAPGAPTVLVYGKPMLNNSSKLICQWAGVIQVLMPATMKEQCP